jgi:hypothetical protein
MSKVLITGDIHLHDFRNHNLFNDPQFRLKQFDKLARRIVNLATSTEASTLIIAGDFLHVANPRPYIVNAAFDFLDILTEDMDVYLTHGQHDYDSRTSMHGEHTLLTLCNRLPRVHYLHRRITSICGKEFYFLGWEPNWTELVQRIEPCDVLIGHAQPEDVAVGQRGLRMYGGVKLETTSHYEIAFLGDIHYHQSRDNWVIPGTPIQHSFNDKPDVGIIILDTETLEWRHIPTIVPKHWDFLQLLITDKPSKNKFVVTRAKKSTENIRIQTRVDRSINTMAVIQASVEDAQLEYLHTELLGSVPKDVREEVDLNFSIERLKIQNFRSIENFEWTNIGEGVKLVSGANGTGKSSLVNALMFALVGEGSARNLTRRGSGNMFVEVEILYGRLRHIIRRGWATGGRMQYFINGEEIPAENQRVLLNKIGENLPFLKFTDLFYHAQDRPGFLASYNYSALGLKVVQELHHTAQLKAALLEQEMGLLRERIASVAAVVQQENLVDFTIMEMVNEGKESSLRTLKEATRELLTEERQKYEDARQKKTRLSENVRRASSSISLAKGKRSQIEKRTCFTCGQNIDREKSETLLNELNKEIGELEESLIEYTNEFEQINIVPLEEKVHILEKKFELVVERLAELISLRDRAESLEILVASIENAKAELNHFNEDMNILKQQREDISAYLRIMETNGPVMRSLLVSVSEILSTEDIRVRAHKELVNKELRPDFGIDMKVAGKWISYDELSGGQKTIADLTILEKLIKIVGGIGLLIFDETFKFLDNDNLEIVVDLLKSTECCCIFIISHAEGFPYWDLSIQTRVDKSGYTTYTMR